MKGLEKVDIEMFLRLLRRRTLTGVQKRQLRAILTGAIRTCARIWARGRLVSGFAQLADTKQRLGSSVVELPADEPGSDASGTQRQLLNQKDNQLLEWTRNNRTEEMAAIIRKRNEE